MKIINIPAYSYFDQNLSYSYRTDISLYCDNSLLERLKAEYPEASSEIIWRESGLSSGYNDFAARVNNVFKTTVLGPDTHLYLLYNNQTWNPTSNPQAFNIYRGMGSYSKLDLKTVEVANAVPLSGSGITATKTIGLNNTEIHNLTFGVGNQFLSLYSSAANYGAYYTDGSNHITAYVNLVFFPEGLFDSGTLISYEDYSSLPESYRTVIYFGCDLDNDGNITKITNYSVSISSMGNLYGDLNAMFHDFETSKSGISEKEFDDNNPYGQDGSSTTGGGDGSGGGSIDSVDPAQIPALPTINVAQLGLITMYNPSEAGVKQLSDFLWSGAFDLDTYKKLFQDPMEGIIGLAIVPCSPTIGGAANVKIGNIDTGVNMALLATNWKEIDCGWCDVEKYVGCFLDADPYTKIDIYLPFIGMRPLSADDINGGSIHVVYHVDLLTGACACFIEHSERGVIYTYNGSCITNVPITAINFSGAIQNAVSAVISGIGVAAGAVTGAAPVTAMGAMGLLNSAANTAINSKPNIQRSGNLGGSAGILSILTPYVIIERPDMSVPNNLQHFVGQTCNITYTLGQLSGFTMCEYVHIEGCTGTTEEVKEIELLLKEGVYL